MLSSGAAVVYDVHNPWLLIADIDPNCCENVVQAYYINDRRKRHFLKSWRGFAGDAVFISLIGHLKVY